MTLTWTHAVMLTLGLLAAGALAGIPLGMWVASLPVPNRRPRTALQHAQLVESLEDVLEHVRATSPRRRSG